MEDDKEKFTTACTILFISGFSSLVASFALLMGILLSRMRKENVFQKSPVSGQLVLLNLLTSSAIIGFPLVNWILQNASSCSCSGLSTLTFSSVILTFGMKLSIFYSRHQLMKDRLSRTNQDLTGVSINWVKVLNVMIWLVPIGIFIGLSVYFYLEEMTELIYVPRNWNYAVFEKENIRIVILSEDALLFGLYVIVVIVIMVLSCQITLMQHQANKNRGIIGFHQIQQETQLRRRLYLETFLFIVWWAPCLFLRLYYFASYFLNQEPVNIPVLFYLQALMTPSQGVVDFALFLINYQKTSQSASLTLKRSSRTVSEISSFSSSSQPLFMDSSNSLARNGIPHNRTFSLRFENSFIMPIVPASLP